jgi:transcription-repair coupling factor (superfamily II helicase)
MHETEASWPLKDLHDTFLSRYPALQGALGGVLPAARSLVVAALAGQVPGPLLCLTASGAEAERLVDDLQELLNGAPETFARLFPEAEMSLFDQGESDPERLRVLHELFLRRPVIVVASLLAFLQAVPAPKRLRRRVLKVGDTIDREKLVETLLAWEYQPADLVERTGHLAQRGAVLDLYPSNSAPLRVQTEGDALVSLRSFSTLTQLSEAELESVAILPMVEPQGQEALIDYFQADDTVVLVEPSDLQERLGEMATAAGSGWKFSAYTDVEILGDDQPDDWKQFLDMLAPRPQVRLSQVAAESRVGTDAVPSFQGLKDFAAWAKARRRRGDLVIVTQHPHRLRKILTRHGVSGFQVVDGVLSQGFRAVGLFDLITDRELFGITLRHRHLAKPDTAFGELDFNEGDHVVHADRGIGRFLGLVPVTLEGATRDLIKLQYANDHTLMVPPEQIDLLSPFRAGDKDDPSLSRLDTEAWQKTLTMTRASVAATAQALQRKRDQRKRRQATAVGPDTAEQEELEAAFPFDETPSQLAAIERIKADLERKVAMDRLLCGDVGYGKTEVALRAAFKVVSNGLQSALLAPTTVLAQQHYEDFRARMEPLGVEVKGLWGGAQDAETIIAGLADGTVLMVVGTHSLLSDGVAFSRLGLLVIDEEQSFGVAHKDRLRKLAEGVHVLSMSATPIPRTMQLALAGVRDISLLDAPPEARRPIRTYLLVEEKKLVAAALMRELERGGQAFVLHNRVEDLPRVAGEVEKLVAGARVAVAHGQLESGKLEQILAEFERGDHDILVCSTIIETGIDFPNVNTIVIKDAHMFGLAQLYQIRGRVGRSGRQAYCYLMVPKTEDLNEKARLRLETINGMTGLGSGYQIAMRDLQIRGAGDLLGGEQSGEFARVGYALYAQLLEDALAPEGEEGVRPSRVAVEIPVDAYFPEHYVPPISLRIALYRRLEGLTKLAQVDKLGLDLADRFGPAPQPVLNLLDLARLRLLAQRHQIETLRVEQQFGERSLICRGAGDPIVLTKPPKGPALLSFALEGLKALA